MNCGSDAVCGEGAESWPCAKGGREGGAGRHNAIAGATSKKSPVLVSHADEGASISKKSSDASGENGVSE